MILSPSYAAPQLNGFLDLPPHSASGLQALRFMRGSPLLSLRDSQDAIMQVLSYFNFFYNVIALNFKQDPGH